MTSTEMWKAVGRELQRARLDRQWKPLDVERHGGPTYKTVQAIEAGDAGTIDSLEKCARALELSIVDVLYAVLASRVAPLSPEAAQVVRKFTETTVAGRTALVAMANALPQAAVTTGLPPIPPAAEAAPPGPGPRRPALPATTRRTAR